jgi:transcription elongation factor Elf1
LTAPDLYDNTLERQHKNEKIITTQCGICSLTKQYTLKKVGTGQDFGQEAIDIYLKRMGRSERQFVLSPGVTPMK